MFVMKNRSYEEVNCSSYRINDRFTALFANYYSGEVEG